MYFLWWGRQGSSPTKEINLRNSINLILTATYLEEENIKIMKFNNRNTLSKVVSLVAIFLCFFQLYTGLFGLLPSPQQRSLHIGLTMILLFLTTSLNLSNRENLSFNSFSSWLDLFFISVIIISTFYVFFNYKRFIPAMMSQPNYLEKLLALFFIIAVIEGGRRTIGWTFPILTLLALLYAFFGHLIPGKFGHPGFSVNLIMKELFFSISGVFGFLTGYSASYICLFVIFGTILLVCGGGDTFIKIAILLVGKLKGGPAKIAVVSSGLFAMLSGSPMANAATTGNFTIPMMKGLGYNKEFAAGVETAASSGGVLTPPIMGAAAFLMAEFLGMSYLKVCIAAAIPALLFYLSVFMGVHLLALKGNLPPLSKESMPKIENVLNFNKLIILFVPIIVLLFTLIRGNSLSYVGASACWSGIICYILFPFSLEGIKLRIKRIPHILEEGGKSLIVVVPILACANIILRLVDYTGLSIKFSQSIMSLGHSSLFMSLLLTGILVMILGTGLPTTAAYVLGIVVSAPMLETWGILPLASHLFILYYSTLATITPPVCPTAYVAAAIAKADWFRTAIHAIKLCPVLYIIPFLFVYDTKLILVGDTKGILVAVATAIIGTTLLQNGIVGYFILPCSFLERIILLISGLFLIIPEQYTDIIGLAMLGVVFFIQSSRKKHS